MRLGRASLISLWFFLAPALGALLTSSAHAQPPIGPGTVQLRWDACYADGGTNLRTFACNTNSGSEVLVVTATPAVNLPQFNGFEASLYVVLVDPTLPSWWQIGTGLCRSGTSISASFIPPAGATNCVDPFGGMAAGGLNYSPGNGAPNQALVRLVAAIPGSISLPAGQNLFMARVIINHARSTGAGSCAGCSAPAGIGLERVTLTQPQGVGNHMILYPEDGTESDFVSWQSALAFAREYYYSPSTSWHKFFTVSLPTAARRPTWGGIKSLYRR